MSQFSSELDANDTRAKFDALSRSPLGLTFAKKVFKAFHGLLLDPKSGFDVAETIADLASALQEEGEARTTHEREFLLEAVVLTVKRHEKALGALSDRLELVETRLEHGLKVALRFPNDGSRATLERLAIVVVRGSVDFGTDPLEQTTEFLRIAGQITESELVMLRRINEFQEGLSLQDSHSINQGNWLSNVAQSWVSMSRKYPPALKEWMHRKSALVRLESYGFIEKIPGSPTGEGSEMGKHRMLFCP